jgi:hypothetical protein
VLAVPAEGLVLGGRLGARLHAAGTLVALLVALQQKEKPAVSMDANRRSRRALSANSFEFKETESIYLFRANFITAAMGKIYIPSLRVRDLAA